MALQWLKPDFQIIQHIIALYTEWTYEQCAGIFWGNYSKHDTNHVFKTILNIESEFWLQKNEVTQIQWKSCVSQFDQNLWQMLNTAHKVICIGNAFIENPNEIPIHAVRREVETCLEKPHKEIFSQKTTFTNDCCQVIATDPGSWLLTAGHRYWPTRESANWSDE